MSDSDEDHLEELMEEEANDPYMARVEAQIEAQLQARLLGGSNQRNKRRYIERDHQGDHDRLFAYYFSAKPLYTNAHFRRRFRMKRPLFLRIVESLGLWSPYFRLRYDAFGKVGLSPLQKCTAAIRMLAYGSPADLMDESFGVPESSALECMAMFVQGIRAIFGPEYLRRPNAKDVQRLQDMGEARGFPGMLGSLDCMHWHWLNCPVAWKGQFTRGDHGVPTIMLEAVASEDLWIWHAFFGVAGSNNDINVLNQSPLFTEVLQGTAPQTKFLVNGAEYNMGYYLVDGIYPEWATFVKSIPLAQNEKDTLFAVHQTGARKDVERAFGVLQKRFAIVRQPARLWQREEIADIMYACVILHNMIIDDERGDGRSQQELVDEIYEEGRFAQPIGTIMPGPIVGFHTVLERNREIRERTTHRRLQAELVEHIWQKFGPNAA